MGIPPMPTPRAPATAPAKRAAITTLVVSTVAIGASYASAFLSSGAPRWAGWLFAVGMTGALLGTLALGAMRPDRGLGRLVAPFVVMAFLLGGGLAAIFLLPGQTGAAEPLLLGLPRRAAVVLYAIGLLPTLVLPVAYALTFTDQTLRPEDLERIHAAARAARAKGER